MSKAEDPEKILEQSVNDMQGDLIKMRQASAQVRTDMSAGLNSLWPRAARQHLCRFRVLMLCNRRRLICLIRDPDVQVVASQKQLEMKYKQAQQIAVRASCQQILLTVAKNQALCLGVMRAPRMTGTRELSWRSARARRNWPAKPSDDAKPTRFAVGRHVDLSTPPL